MLCSICFCHQIIGIHDYYPDAWLFEMNYGIKKNSFSIQLTIHLDVSYFLHSFMITKWVMLCDTCDFFQCSGSVFQKIYRYSGILYTYLYPQNISNAYIHIYHILANTRWRLKLRATHNSTSHLICILNHFVFKFYMQKISWGCFG